MEKVAINLKFNQLLNLKKNGHAGNTFKKF